MRELSVRALVSNRHLTEQLPVGEAGADFHLADDTSLRMRCVAGPTPPRESVVAMERRQRSGTPPGAIAWKLINLLSLNHLGLTDRDPQDRAGGLRELLALFADLSDVVTERRMRGIVGVSSRPITRRLRQANGFNAARGIEITVRFDERAFEGNGVMLLGAVLDRFFAEYSSINSFTETVIESQQRGIVKRWPPRSGRGQAAMSYRDDLRREPCRFDLFAVMREFERSSPGQAAHRRRTACCRRRSSASGRIRFSNFPPRTCLTTRTATAARS